jgi:hypothetical protein
MISARDASLTTLRNWETDGTKLEIVVARGAAGVSFSGRGKVVGFSEGQIIFGGVAPDVLRIAEDWRLTVDFRDGHATLRRPRGESDLLVIAILDGPVSLLLTGPDPEFSLGRL